MGYLHGRLGSGIDLNPNQNLSGPAWDWIVEMAKGAGKTAVDYCKENPDKCFDMTKEAIEKLTAKPIELPALYGGLDTSVGGGYNVSPSVSALWVRSSPFSDDSTTQVTTLDSGQGVHVVGATKTKPDWFYINVPIDGYVYAGNLVKTPDMGPDQTFEPDFVDDHGIDNGRGGMGALVPIALALALLNK